MLQKPRAIVVGGGIGGLTAAIDLARQGLAVELLEQANALGGKVRTSAVGAANIGAGPSVLTMGWVFEELFRDCGRSFSEEVPSDVSKILARHAWSDGTTFDLYADLERSVAEVTAIFGATEGAAFRRFSKEMQQIYETVEGPFLRSQKPGWSDIFRHTRVLGPRSLLRIDGLRTLSAALEERFKEPRLRQLFGRYATYCGSSPFQAPATLGLVAHVESSGVLRVRGGMQQLAVALSSLAKDMGVEVKVGVRIDEILVEHGRASGVRCAQETRRADIVVFNGDVSALGAGLLGAKYASKVPATPTEERSLSAVTWCVLGRAEGTPLVHHNVFFSDDYAAEFSALLRDSSVPHEPTVYVCAQDRGDDEPTLAEERLFVLVNAPATGDKPQNWNESEKQKCRDNAWKVMERCGVKICANKEATTTPADFHASFPATGGALYGPISRGPTAPLKRQGARTKIPGLYVAGGSAHPGPGVPMAALSGRLAAAAILEDLPSTARFRTAATFGTT